MRIRVVVYQPLCCADVLSCAHARRSVASFTLLTLTRHLSATTTQLSRGNYKRQGRKRDATTSTMLIACQWYPIRKQRRTALFLIPHFVKSILKKKSHDKLNDLCRYDSVY
ncbi:hypothetical protein ACS0PU_009497 [Formica fusca]